MAKLNVIDLAGASLGEIEVSDEVFAAPVKEHLLWEVVRHQRAARRAGTHSTKTRAEIHITGKKMTKQKGSGGARHGSRRANIFKGGGQVHGPRPHKYILNVNKKAMAGALRSALTVRASKGDLIVVRDLTLPEIKTKALFQALASSRHPSRSSSTAATTRTCASARRTSPPRASSMSAASTSTTSCASPSC
jgi:large subunit ribosomal protein L4